MGKATWSVGARHGSLTIVGPAEPEEYHYRGKVKRRTRVTVQCDCGAPPEPRALAPLKSRPPKRCASCPAKHEAEPGDQFNRWKILSIDRSGEYPMAEAVCDCGTSKTVDLRSIVVGLSQSCGCWKFEARRTHGLTNPDHPEHGRYVSWQGMKWRCGPTGLSNYAEVDYDPRWETFEGFEEHPPAGTWFSGAELCRTADEGDYTPENTQEANLREQFEQSAERTSWGELALDVARRNGIADGTYRTRVVRGWSVDDACTLPLRQGRSPDGRRRPGSRC